MPRTVTCECGKRFSVGMESRRETVDCPACGKRVALNGAASESTPLSFGVKVVGGSSSACASSAVEERQIAFSCPGCGKAFRQTVRAAGKPTRCPKCEVEFVIPSQTNAPDVSESDANGPDAETEQPEANSSAPKSVEHTLPPIPPEPKPHAAADGVEAAVAAYSAGKGASKRRLSMVPVGYCFIMLGGLLSIFGSFLMVKGSMNAFSGVIGGGLGGGAGGGLIDPMAEYSKLLQDLAGEANGDRRRKDQPKNLLENRPPGNAEKAGKSYQETLKEQKEKHGSGKTMLIGGVIASGVGMLITFIGGIYLLAGLIGRFIQPQPTVALQAPVESEESATA